LPAPLRRGLGLALASRLPRRSACPGGRGIDALVEGRWAARGSPARGPGRILVSRGGASARRASRHPVLSSRRTAAERGGMIPPPTDLCLRRPPSAFPKLTRGPPAAIVDAAS